MIDPKIIEALSGQELSGREFQIVLYVMSKGSECVSMEEISKHVGIAKTNLCRALKRLEKMNILKLSKMIIIKNDNYQKRYNFKKKVALSTDYKLWIIKNDNYQKRQLSKMIIIKNDNYTDDTTSSTPGPAKKPTPKKKAALTDEEWMAMIKESPAYAGMDVDHEKAKMEAWCMTHNKLPSRKRLLNWLNNASADQKPMKGAQHGTDRFDPKQAKGYIDYSQFPDRE